MTTYKAIPGPQGVQGPPGPVPASTGGRKYIYQNGANTGYQTPDTAALDLTTAVSQRALVRPDAWVTATVQSIGGKWNATTNNRSYLLSINTNGALRASFSTNGTTIVNITSTVPIPSVTNDGGAIYVRADLISDNGSGQSQATFYYSFDGATWTLLDTVTNATPGPFFSGSAIVRTGQQANSAATPLIGRLYKFEVWDGTPTLIAALDARVAGAPPATYTDTTGKVWTPDASTAQFSDEVNDQDFLDKTLRLDRVVPGAVGQVATVQSNGKAGWATPLGADPPIFRAWDPLYHPNPTLFGTNLDNSDDTTGILAAISAATASRYSGKSRGGVVLAYGVSRLTQTIVLPDWVSIEGLAASYTRLTPATAFDVTTAMIQWGTVGSPSFSSSIRHITIDGLDTVHIPVIPVEIQQGCSTDDVTILNWTQKGMKLDGTGGGIQDIALRNIRFSGPAAGWDCAIELTNVSGQVLLDSITGDAATAGGASNCFMRIIGGQATTVMAPHMEGCVDGIQLDLGAKATIIGSVGETGMTNHVHALSTHTGHYLLQMVNKNSATNNLKDDARGVTNTSSVIVLNADGVTLA